MFLQGMGAAVAVRPPHNPINNEVRKEPSVARPVFEPGAAVRLIAQKKIQIV